MAMSLQLYKAGIGARSFVPKVLRKNARKDKSKKYTAGRGKLQPCFEPLKSKEKTVSWRPKH